MSALFLLALSACSPAPRPYYIRSAGTYVAPKPSVTPTAAVPDDLPEPETGEYRASRLRRASEAYLGVPYALGGQDRRGMDCSGFIRQVFAEVYGMSLPRTSARMHGLGKPVAKQALKPGDLVFFKSRGVVDHAGIYMGRNYFIHSATSVGVSYSTLDAPYFGPRYAGARRLLE